MQSFDEPPEWGPARIFRGQIYERIGFQPHVSRDGEKTTLAVLQSHCAECGARFEVTVGLFTKRFSPNRRCQRHKRPGQRVQRLLREGEL